MVTHWPPIAGAKLLEPFDPHAMQRDLHVDIRRRSRISPVEFLGVLTVFGLVMGAMFTFDTDTRVATFDRSCIGNLHSIRIALRTYQEQYGTLPPAYVSDRSGAPMHSWRVLILPALGRLDIYRRYHLDEPWNSPHNLLVAGEMPAEYRCPTDDQDSDHETSYLAVVGEGTVWPGAAASRIAADDHRIAVVEVMHSKIIWTEPRDLDLESIDTLNRGATPSLATHHERHARFASLNHLIILKPSSGDGPDAGLLRQLLVDGKAFERIDSR
jgi:hypothetical protein